MKFLVVDDEVAICLGTARRLQRFLSEEHFVECAYNGVEALEKIAASPPDILLTDIRMGDVDGLTLIERARQLCPDLACIIITAFDTFQYARQAIRLEVKDFLVKPYDENDLRGAVEHVVAGLEQARSRSFGLLERRLYLTLRGGGTLEPELFVRAGLLRPPERVRCVVWSGESDKLPEWTGKWCFRDVRHGYQLVDDDRDELLQWMRACGVRFGISMPDDDLGRMWKQAQRALEITGYENMPRWVFFQETLADERSLRNGHVTLWAMNYIAEHVGQPISMEEICAQLHLNYSYFSRHFKQQTGVPFSEYLLKSQMQWAAERMMRGMRVNEAASVLGYGSAESFGKAFARVFGSAPRNYLNQMRKENQK